MEDSTRKIIDGAQNKFKDEQIIQGWKLILDGLRLDLKDANFKGTPERILRSYYEIFQGLNSEEEIKKLFLTSFPSNYKGMVIVDNIKCFSVCPHHLLTVEYKVHVGYISENKMIGISKLPRLVQLLARRPVLQETFTEDISKILMDNLKAEGVMVMVYGMHNCMRIRGIEKPDAVTITSSIKGIFEEHVVREEFMSLVNLTPSER
jgi:GTP cyclohydrolase I